MGLYIPFSQIFKYGSFMLEGSKEEINNLREEINKLRDDFNDYKNTLKWVLKDVLNEVVEDGLPYYISDKINRDLQ